MIRSPEQRAATSARAIEQVLLLENTLALTHLGRAERIASSQDFRAVLAAEMSTLGAGI